MNRNQARRMATLHDVARAAGVSHQTVSRLVHGASNINPEMRSRIEAAIADLGYLPNLNARSLASRTPLRIAALAYEMRQIGPARILQGASNTAREAGYVLDVITIDPGHPGSLKVAIAQLKSTDLAGVLVFAPIESAIEELREHVFGVPVHLESEAGEGDQDDGETPNAEGSRLLVRHLAERGHQRFFCVTGPLSWPAARHRLEAYRDELSRLGLRSLGEAEGDWTPMSGYAAAGAMPVADVTAVVAGSDQMALGVLHGLRERGISVPQDVSVVGFDDLPEAAFFQPPLTTVRLDFEQQGRIAMLRLIARISGIAPEEPLSLRPMLVERASTTVVRSATP